MYRQVGWQGCVARLLVREVVLPELDTMVSVEDVIALEDEEDDDGDETGARSPMSPSHYINKVNR